MSKQSQYKKYSVCGVEIDALKLAEAANYICDWAKDSDRPSGYVVKPYVEFIDAVNRDKATASLLNNAELCIADSVAIQWAALYLYGGKPGLGRLFGTLSSIVFKPNDLKQIIPERAAGVSFTWPLLRAAASRRLRVYLIGHPKKGTIERTVAVVRKEIPDIDIVGWFDGYEINSNYEAAVNEIKAAQPDLVLVGIGFPKQEQIMARLTANIAHGVFIGEGGTFDYEQFGGSFRRAPKWMRRIGLEWLWRLVLEPSRIKRQLSIPRFILDVYHSAAVRSKA